MRALALLSVCVLGLAVAADSHAQQRRPVRKSAPKKAAPKPAAIKILPEYKDLPILGAYTLRPGNGTENFAIRVVFRADGTWTWVGPNFKSEGRYWYKPGFATLDYRSIDGKAQKPGTVRAKIDFLDNHRAFVVDARVYGKKGTPDYVPPKPEETTAPPPPSDAEPPPTSNR
jgi:hypothetical protein